ncbi:MAG: hypothetical protein GWP19_10320, partial [Planctomycetia bacterium]|nr:hypothetical protein [Planctomycetia bacterium]
MNKKSFQLVFWIMVLGFIINIQSEINAQSPLIRPPYLQSVTQDSVYVMWGDTNTEGELFWGDTLGIYTDSVSSVVFATFDEKDNNTDQVHSATITGLTAGQKVYYYIKSGNYTEGYNDSTYYAIAAPDSDAAFHFAVYGDSRNAFLSGDVTNHKNVIATMITHNPDLVLHSGDIAREGYLYEFNDEFFKVVQGLSKNTPFCPTIGNHELDNGGYLNPGVFSPTVYEDDIKQYRDVYGLPTNNPEGVEDYYSFDYGMVHFVSLNTEWITGNYKDGARATTMKTWLEADLVSTNKPWKVVFFHIPYHWTAVDNAWRTVFENNDVDLVMTGHTHNYHPHLRNGVTYLTTGGGGSPLNGVNVNIWSDYYINGAFSDYHFIDIDVTTDKLQLNVYDDTNYLRHWIEIDADGTVKYPQLVTIDDFETYTTTEDLQAVWDSTYIPSEFEDLGATFESSLAAGGDANTGNVMRLDFSFPAGSAGAWAAVGRTGSWNWSTHKGIKFWIRDSTTDNSDQFCQIRIIEAEGGDQWVASIPLSGLDTAGEYGVVHFNNFEWYAVGDPTSQFANNVLDLDNITAFYIGAAASSEVATENSSSTLWIDDITAITEFTFATQLDDNFDVYENSNELLLKWDKGPWWWNDNADGEPPTMNMSVNLDVDGGVNGSKAMSINYSYNSGVKGPQCIIGHEPALENRTDMTDYKGIKIWMKKLSVTGDEPYFTIRLLEDPAGGEEKWLATKSLSEVGSEGGYVYFDFDDDFVEYKTNSGRAMDRTDIKR